MTELIKKETIKEMNKLAAKGLLKAFGISFIISLLIGVLIYFDGAEEETIPIAIGCFIIALILFIPVLHSSFQTLHNSLYLKNHRMRCSFAKIVDYQIHPMYYLLKRKYRQYKKGDIALFSFQNKMYKAYIFKALEMYGDDGLLIQFVDVKESGKVKVFAIPTVYARKLANHLREYGQDVYL